MAISTLVASGGVEVVDLGGVTSGALVLKGGLEYVGVGLGQECRGNDR